MDVRRVAMLHEVLSHTGWVEGARSVAAAIRRSTTSRGGLLVVGTEHQEPWHLTAHLDDEARWADLPELAPTLVRWQPEPGAPEHLSVGLERLEAARRGESVFVVAPEVAGAPLLERVWDARRAGATVVSLDAGDPELGDLAHERMVVAPSGLAVPEHVLVDASLDASVDAFDAADAGGAAEDAAAADDRPPVSFDVAQHLVGAAVGERQSGRRGWRDRLAAALDVLNGPMAGR